ncbi:MAG: ASCH domain-containing protein [Bacteroidales bacterium]|jgi:hypothetical protein|nr:ASCH domain-containing protein [Bacteroidales bacterium]MCI2122338.1 ASCH domain-containing protein [Bacteroidales bacterium]MCI2145735.1 ASCH domain-containing protein [Bacteroidales bacterium]
MEKTNKENTLYLPIKQTYFDQIVAGTKKEEYREVKDTTYKKYLVVNKDGCILYRDSVKVDEANVDECGLSAFNGGVFPFDAIPYKYLSLAVGYAKERDKALVEVTGITFEIEKNQEGKDMVFTLDGEEKVVFTDDGPAAFWMIVYHLGKVVELHRKGE